MKREFKITLSNDETEDDLLPFIQAEARESFLFELFHNFFRRWENDDELVDIDEVKEKLFELRVKYKVFLKSE
jgi:hypothetical protein